MIERTGSKLTWDSEAALAIRSLPKSDIGDRLHLLELHYHAWTGRTVDEETGHVVGRRWFTRLRLFQMWLGGKPARIFRAEMALAAGAIRDLLNNSRAETIRGDFYETYLKMVEAHRSMRTFLHEHFERELATAEALDESLDMMIRKLLIELETRRESAAAAIRR